MNITSGLGTSALASGSGNRGALGLLAPHGSWERNAPWVAPLLIAGLLALATFFMFASSGAALI